MPLLTGKEVDPFDDDDSDFDEEEQDIGQKEIMSNQITQLLMDRVKRLNSSFQEAQDILGADVDPSSNKSTAKLMKDRAARKVRQNLEGNGSADGKFMFSYRPTPSRTFTTRDLFKDKSFSTVQQGTQSQSGIVNQLKGGPSEKKESFLTRVSSASDLYSQRKLQTTPSDRRASSSIQPPSSSDQREKVLQERELNSIADHHVTRSVENVAYRYGMAPPLKTESKLIMAYVQTHTTLPEHENIGNTFRFLIRSSLCGDIYECLFWYNWCSHFLLPRNRLAMEQAKIKTRAEHFRNELRLAEEDIKNLKRDLSALYIHLIRMFQKVTPLKRDIVHRYLPFAIAHGILVALRYLCPGSRHLYTKSLQEKVYSTCCELLLGTEVSKVSIAATRGVLFPLESRTSFVQEDSTVSGHDEPTNNNQEGDFEKKSIDETNEVEDRTVSGWDQSETSRKTTQQRLRYDSMKVGCLLKDLLCNGAQVDSDVRPGTAPPHILCRTIPTQDRKSRSLAARTAPRRAQSVASIMKRYNQEMDDYSSFVQKSRATLRSRTLAISRQCDEILRSGVAGVERFCSDLSQNEHEAVYKDEDVEDADINSNMFNKSIKQKPRRKRTHAPDGRISGESKGVRNKHLQGEQKVDWHANLAVHINLPPAERIITVTEKIEASKKSDGQKLRTRARIMLCGVK